MLSETALAQGDLVRLDFLQAPVWIFDIQHQQMWWANQAALRLWNASSREELLSRNFADISDATHTRLRAYLAQLEQGKTVVEQWTFYPEGQPVSIRCVCSGIQIEAGRLAMLVEGVPGVMGEIAENTLRAIEALRHTAVLVSLYTLAGEPLLQNPAAIECYGDWVNTAGSVKPRLLDQFLDPHLAQHAIAQAKVGISCSIEAQVRTRSGTRWHELDMRCTNDPVTGNRLLLVNEKDITRRKYMQTALHESEERWQLVLQGNNDAIWDWNLLTDETFRSARWYELLGYQAHEISNHYDEWLNRIHRNDRDQVIAAQQAYLAKKIPQYVVEYRLQCKDGRYKYVLCRGQALWDSQGKPVRMVGSTRDITEQKQAEAALLKQTEISESLKSVLDHMGDAVIAADSSGKVIFTNSAVEQLLGQATYALGTTTWQQPHYFYQPDETTPYPASQLPLMRAIQGETVHNVELVFRPPTSAQSTWLIITGRPLNDPNGTIKGGVIVCRDITQRKRAEQALQQSRATNRALLETIPDLIIRMTRDGTYIDFVPARNFSTLMPSPEMRGKSVYEVLPVEIAQQRMHYVERALQTGELQIHEYELLIDDALQTEEARIAVSGTDEVLVIIRDISDRKRAEQALTEQKEFLRTVIDANPNLIFVKDWNGRFTLVNQAVANVYGTTVEALLGKTDADFNPNAAEFERFLQADREVMATLQCKIIAEETVSSPTGEVRYFQTFKKPLLASNGKAQYILGVCTDITERKQFEAFLQHTNDELGIRVEARTTELKDALERLRQEIAQRQRVEATNALLATALEFAGDAIEITDADMIFQYVNAAFEQSTGYARHEVVGKMSVSLLQSGEHDEAFHQQIRHTLALGQVWRGELINQCKDGSSRYLDATISPVCNVTNQATYYLAVKRDITDRKHMEAAWLQSEARFRAAIEGSLDAFFLFESVRSETGQIIDFTCVELNSNAEKLISMPREAVLGKQLCDLLPIQPIKGLLEKYVHVVETGEALEEEFVASIPNLPASWLHQQVVPLTDGVAITCRDITKRKRAEAEILKALTRERELSELKSRFVSMTSHEFRTPLTTIQSSADLLEYFDCDPAEQAELFQQIKTAVQHMVQLLEDALFISRAEAGKLELRPSWFDLENLCRIVISELETTLGRQITLKLNHPAQSHSVYLDEKLIRQILINLLSNAIKYSLPGSPIDFELTHHSEQIIFRIEDQGIGIPQRDQQHLFEFFHRASNVGTISGTGLGLAIAKQCIDLHQGTISVESIVGQGTTFTIALPLNVERIKQ